MAESFRKIKRAWGNAVSNINNLKFAESNL
jgi:hypothetical protein